LTQFCRGLPNPEWTVAPIPDRTKRFLSVVCYRLLIPFRFQQYDRRLYPDSDMLADSDLPELHETDLRGPLFARRKICNMTDLQYIIRLIETQNPFRSDIYVKS